MHIPLTTNPPEYCSRMKWFRTVPWLAESWSPVVCLFTVLICGERQLKSQVSKIYKGHSLTERMSGDVCLKKSLGSYITQMLIIKSCWMLSIAIRKVVRFKKQILFHSSWLNVRTLTKKTHPGSMWFIFCNIQHIAQQQSQHKIQRLLFWKERFATSGRHIRDINNVIQMTMSSSKWWQGRLSGRKVSSLDRIAQVVIQKEAFRWENIRNSLFKQQQQTAMDRWLCGPKHLCG